MTQSVAQRVAYRKRKYHADPEFRRKILVSTKASQKRRRGTPDGFILSELRRIKHRCKERGLDFDLTPQDLEVPAICPVLGIPITLGATPRADGSPSVDRMNPNLGYVRGNVKIISWRANHLKNNCVDPSELRKVADFIDRTAPCPT